MIDTIPLQSGGIVSQLPTPSSAMFGAVILAFLAGMSVPTAYGIERLQGLGRFVASKWPYKAPPGMDAGEAMEQAVELEESTATEDDVDNGDESGEQADDGGNGGDTQ